MPATIDKTYQNAKLALRCAVQRVTVQLVTVQLVAVLASVLLAAPGALAAGEKRVTVPIALPFQQQASSHNTSSAAATYSAAAPLQTNAFTQRPLPASSAAASSVAAPLASSATSQSASGLAGSGGLSANTFAAQASASAALSSPVASSSSRAAASVAANKTVASKAQASSKTAPARAVDAPEAAARLIPTITTAAIDAPRYAAGHPEAFIAEFEDYVAKKVAPFVPGVAIVVVSGGQVKSLQGYGVRRAGTREKITPDTIFRLASLSKPVAATAASVLVNEGKISWDTTITSVLPQVAFKNAKYSKQLTFRHALSQSSGLPRHTYSHFIDQNMAYNDIVNRLRYVNFVCPPGKCYDYQNVVYSLAGDMMKKKAGMSFEAYVEQKLFDPLGMRSASYGLNNYNASPNRAAPHIASGKRWAPTAVVGNWYKVAPAAGVNASIVDMSRFLLGQVGKYPEVLPPAVLNPIQSRVTKNTPAQNYYGVRKAVGNTAYGLGWRVFDYGRNKNFVHHGGHVKGFRTEMVFNRDLQIGMVFLTNSETRLARDIIFKFLDMHARAQDAARKTGKK